MIEKHVDLSKTTLDDLARYMVGVEKGDIELADEQLKYDALYLVDHKLLDETSHDVAALEQFHPQFWPPSINTPFLVVGSGNGLGLKWLLRRGINAYGIDISRTASKYYKDIEHRYIVAQAHKMPFISKAFSMSMCVDVLEHIPTNMIEKTIEEIGRVTAKACFVQVGTKESVGIKGMHLTVKDSEWWKSHLETIGDIYSEASGDGHYACFLEVR